MTEVIAQPQAPRSTRAIWPAVALLIITIGYSIWPGDAPFAFDEPQLIGRALRANQAHTLASSGLHGTKGITYSPLPIWIYQGMLLVSHDLRVLVAIRAIICAAAVGFSLLWLAKNLELPTWFAPVVMLSPTLWFFCRQLWDNTFCIPLSALALGTFVQFLKTPSRRALAACFGLLLAALFVHVMALALVIPIASYLLTARRKQVWQNWWIIAIELMVACAIAIPWFRTMFEGQGADLGHGPDGWWFPLLGARTISGANLSYIFGDQWDSAGGAVGTVVRVATYVSLLAYPLMWLGTCVAAYRAMEALSRQRPIELRDEVSIILLSMILMQTVIDGPGNIWGLPHYYNGNWIVFPMLVWLGIDLLKHIRLATVAIALQGATLALLLGFLALRIHRGNGIVHQFYGPNINLRITVIDALNARGWHGPFAFVQPGSDAYVVDPLNSGAQVAPVYTNVPGFLSYPQSMNVLQELTSPGAATFPENKRIQARLINPQSTRCDLEILER
jgi:hypothetical protein